MNRNYQITLAAELESLAVFRQLIKHAGVENPQIDQPTLYDLQLAVDEAATNIIKHGYAGMDPGSIIFELVVDDQQVRMTLTDFGRQFEPSSAPAPDLNAALENLPLGGFGLYFIYQTMDEVDYAADACGNRLFLVKQLP